MAECLGKSAGLLSQQQVQVRPQDGFYGEVLRGLVIAGHHQGHAQSREFLDELKHYYPQELRQFQVETLPSALKKAAQISGKTSVFGKLPKASKTSLKFLLACSLVACQSTAPASLSSGADKKVVPPSSSVGDFNIKYYNLCEGTDFEGLSACYASGNGFPQFELVPIPPMMSEDDYCRRYTYCQFEEQNTLSVSYEPYENSSRVKIKVESNVAWHLTITKESDSNTVVYENSGTGNTEFDWDPWDHGPGQYSIYAKNAEKHLESGSVLEYLPVSTPTPTLPPATSNPSPPNNPPTSGGTDTCEDAPLLLPSQLTPVVQAAQRIVPPLLAEEHFLPPGLDSFEQRLKQIDEFNRKIAEEQAKAKPNQNKITNWTQQKEAKQAEVNQAVSSTTTLLENLSSQRSNLRNQINTVAQDAELSQDQYQSPEDPDLPQTLEDYKKQILILQDNFAASLANQNTHELLTAANILADQQELYKHLLQDYLSLKFSFGSELPNEQLEDELENLNTPKKVLRYLGKRIVLQNSRLSDVQSKIQTELNKHIQEAEAQAIEIEQLYQEVDAMVLQAREHGLNINVDDLFPIDISQAVDYSTPDDFQIQGAVLPPILIVGEGALGIAALKMYELSNSLLANPATAQKLAEISTRVLLLASQEQQTSKSRIEWLKEQLSNKDNLFPEEIAAYQTELTAQREFQQKMNGLVQMAKKNQNKANKSQDKALEKQGKVKGNCNSCHKYSGKKVLDILKLKRGSIKNAPLPNGTPSWKDIENWTWEQIVKEAKKNDGIDTIKKLLTDSRFDK